MTFFVIKHLYSRKPWVILSSLMFVVATAGAAASIHADEALPAQDQGLARALENHPDIVAAKAKVALVEAELYGKRMEVSRQVLGLYGNLKTMDSQIDAAKAALTHSKAQLDGASKAYESGAADQSTKLQLAAVVQAAEGKLVELTTQRERAEKELRLLVGESPRAKESKPSKEAFVPARQEPQGAIVATWNSKAEEPIKISYTEQPLAEVMNDLSEKTGIKFSIQKSALEEAGLTMDMPTSWDTNNVPLRAALQAFEDNSPQLQFVLRDYGILLTTKEYAEEHGYVPVLELGGDKATSAQTEKRTR
jgi:hypothetical protein